MSSWNRFQKQNAKKNKVKWFVVARANPNDPQRPLVLAKNGEWAVWEVFACPPGRLFRSVVVAETTAIALASKLAVRVWTVSL